MWHSVRARRTSIRPQRLVVTKARWLHGARSPVVLMIDDLTNAWHAAEGGASWRLGGDWGGGLDAPNSALSFLEKHLLAEFPEVRTTFFVVAGEISAYTNHQPFSFAAPMDATEESRRFFRKLSDDDRFELAYHGFNHGTAGPTTEQFLQEWRGFATPSAAAAQTRDGLAIFERATGRIPRGGKYGGWDYNSFAGDVVNDCGFLWWCRDWMPRDVSGRTADAYYEPELFGNNLVVALPSTVHGYFWQARQINTLLSEGQVIGIEEHIAPTRPDGLVQTPNIVDDIGELRRLFGYLRTKKVWYANCSDIAAYVVARDRSILHDVTVDGFSVRYEGRVERPLLTLCIDASALCDSARPHIVVDLPEGGELANTDYRFDELEYRHMVTLPLMTGRYRVSSAPLA